VCKEGRYVVVFSFFRVWQRRLREW